MNRRKTRVGKFLERIWHANTLLGIMLAAWFLFGLAAFRSQDTQKLWNVLIASFITVIGIEILLIRNYLLEVLDGMKAAPEQDLGLQAFSSGKDFDAYLGHRLRSAFQLKIIHISSLASSAKTEALPGERQGRSYSAVVDDFVKSGKKLHRIFCKTSNCEVFEWIMEDLKKYEHDRYFVSFLERISIDHLRTFGIMIIDDHEVCIGGLYRTDSKHPTISMTNHVLGEFFQNYFEYLLSQSKSINTVTGTDWNYMNELAAKCRAGEKM